MHLQRKLQINLITYSVHSKCPLYVQCTLYIFCVRAVHISYILCFRASIDVLHCTCSVQLLVRVQLTLHMKIAVCGARAVYSVHQVHRSGHLQHTARAHCSVRCACYVFCAPGAPLRAFIVQSTYNVHVQFILCIRRTLECIYTV